MPLPKNYAKHQWFIDFGGVLVSNRLAIYDDAAALQEKCYAHHGVSPTKVRKVPRQPNFADCLAYVVVLGR